MVNISEAAKRLGVKPKQIKIWLEQGLLQGTRELTKAKKGRLVNLGLVSGFQEHADRWRIERDAIIAFRQKYPNLICSEGREKTSTSEKENEVKNESQGRPDIIDHIEEISEKNGAFAEVGPAYYSSFAKLSSKSMRALIRVLIVNSSENFEKLATQPNGSRIVCERIQRDLSLVSWGIMQIDCFGVPAFFKRIGPEATVREKAALNKRLTVAEKEILETVEELVTYLLKRNSEQIELDL